MKKLFSNVLLATAILMGGGALLSSCSDNGDGPNVEPEIKTAQYSQCDYYGDQYQSKTGRYELMLSTSKVDENGKPTSVGEQYIIQLFSTVATDADNAVPQAGTYLLDVKNSHALNTVAAEGTLIWKYNESLNKSEVKYTDLTVVIAGQGVAMTVDATFTLSDGKKVTVKAKDFTFSNKEDESLIKEDVSVTGGSQAIAGWLGNYELTSGTGGPFSVYQIQFINGAQNAIMNLELYGPEAEKFANAAIPTGNLPIVEMPSSTLSAGKGFFEEGTVGGSYYATLSEQGLSFPLGLVESGSINISKSGANYTISVDCVSTNGFKITGSFTGPIELKNMSGDSTLTEDKVIDLAGVTSGTADFWGTEMFTDATTGCWNILIDSKTANGEAMTMFIITESTTSLDVPTGTFNGEGSVKANTFFPGSLQGNQIYPTSWIHYSATGDGADQFAPLAGGTIKIEKDGANYTFTFDTVDDLENKVTGTWTGTLTVSDMRGTATNSVHKLGTVNSTSLKLNTTNNRFTKVN